MNAFETLGIEPRLVIGREELNQAFRNAGKTAHPDAGGSEKGFAQLKQALDVVQSPARRLKAWLELKGVQVDSRGTISNTLMDEFGRLGEVTQKAEALIRKREAAQSALAKAMLESETQRCREDLEEAMQRLDDLIRRTCGGFEQLERSEVPELVALEWQRDLTFLEKWQASLRALFAKLF